MRVGVLDIGSNTGHLLVVDAHGGAAPLPAYSHKQPLRLAEHLDEDGAVSQTGIDALTSQCVPTDASLHQLARFRDFLSARRELLTAAVNAFLARARGGAAP